MSKATSTATYTAGMMMYIFNRSPTAFLGVFILFFAYGLAKGVPMPVMLLGDACNVLPVKDLDDFVLLGRI